MATLPSMPMLREAVLVPLGAALVSNSKLQTPNSNKHTTLNTPTNPVTQRQLRGVHFESWSLSIHPPRPAAILKQVPQLRQQRLVRRQSQVVHPRSRQCVRVRFIEPPAET